MSTNGPRKPPFSLKDCEIMWRIKLLQKVTSFLAILLPILCSSQCHARPRGVFSQIELSQLLELFMLPRNANYNIVPWTNGGLLPASIEWKHPGIVECDTATEALYHQIFCRSGRAIVAVKGKVTHTVLGKLVHAGRWNIKLMGPHAGAYLVEIESDVNSGELSPTLLADALKEDEQGLSLKSIRKCAEGNSEMFIISGKKFQPAYVIESWSCGSGGCSIQLLLGGDDVSKAGTCS